VHSESVVSTVPSSPAASRLSSSNSSATVRRQSTPGKIVLMLDSADSAITIQRIVRGWIARREYQESVENARANSFAASGRSWKDSEGSVHSSNEDYPIDPAIVLGAKVVVKDKTPLLTGIVLFIGPTEFAGGIWVGLCLDSAKGKNNGRVLQTTYFSCAENYGLFVRPAQLIPLNILGSTPAIPTAAPVMSPEALLRNQRLAGMLKLKISQMMDLMNQQLEIAVSQSVFGVSFSGTKPVFLIGIIRKQRGCSHY